MAYERYESGMRPGVELNQKFAERFAKEMTIPSKGKIRDYVSPAARRGTAR
ncbi:hypothetical protein [Streptomyces sp. NPDC005407]|uniref:hypothetical protein n=1 Tax=Streptomyces sp. NPDC005407 TaxID=3155340 RepID=UPI0033BA6B65